MTDSARPDAAETATGSTDADETEAPEVTAPETANTFDRAYVEGLRKESAGYRDRAKNAEAASETMARRLHAELVRATGRLADPSDLTFDAEHLTDPEKLGAAIDALVADKPHLKNRTPRGDIGQGERGSSAAPGGLLGALKATL
ncbi:hypothetical protein ACNO8X_18350 [Mycobacterium sp. PDNC021]|uniref:hypothetical protein n=1 Tax=Mycobacterium sp. PDNC021 TaxID=3391399 RepID=UPI003AAD2FA7